MIPLKLQIKNFISYGTATQTVDFSPYQLICLSGKNGHGKSALLDALTWVLWGQARKTTNTSKADDGLLRLGQTHMMVCLDFIANGQQYRVRREYTQSPKNYTQLDFGIIDSQTQTYKPLTDKTIKLTQEKLEIILGLNFDAFSNSAFLRQGNSNEFSRKTPKERKEILAAILGINHFEKLRKRASEYAKEAHAKKEHFTQLCNTLSLELGQKTTVDQKIMQLNQELSALVQQEQTFKQALHEIKQQHTQLTAYKTKRDTVTFECDHTQRTLELERTLVLSEITQLRQLFRQQRALRSYAHLEQERHTLSEQLQQLQELNRKRLILKEAYLTFTHEKQTRAQHLTTIYTQRLQELTRACNELTLHLQHTEQKQQELREHYTKTEQALEKLNNNYTHLEQERAQYTLVDPHVLHKREHYFEKRRAYAQTVTTRIQLLTQELSNLQNKHELFKQQESPTCPLCQQTIDLTYQHKVTQEFLTTQRRIQRQLQRLIPLATRLQSLVATDNKEITCIKEQAHSHALCLVQAQELAKAIAAHKITHQEQQIQLETLAKTYTQYQDQLKQLQLQQTHVLQEQSNALEHDSICQELNRKLHEIEAQLTTCVYSAEQEQELLQRLERITHVQRQQSDIAQALARKEEKKQAIHQKVLLCKQLTAHFRLLVQELEQYKTLDAQEQALKQKETDIDTTVTKIYRQKEQVLQQLGALESQRHTLEQRAQELKNHKIAIAALDQTLYEYQALTQALSKDGIQALLIEDALPEIEQEANNLLSKLTDNQAHILLESLRDLRSGGTKETLDIKISDTIGTRPYELFSGGEAFRIDFALRIAISKLLARRAGTALQTLIIDEGFGSQDEEGLSAIMESLYKIQDEFAKIIVVSHLPALKDQFPVHFFIHKGPHGSTVKVLEHG